MTESSPGASDLPVFIVDDHQLVGTSLALSLRAEGMQAYHCGARSVDAILAEAAALPAGLALLDLDLGRDRHGNRIDGIDLVEPLGSWGWRILVLSGSADHGRIGAALEAGALAWVPKNAPFPTLLRAVRDAAAGREVMGEARRQHFIDLHHDREAEKSAIAEKLDRLTQREREVLAELARGRRAQAVADQFVVSLATVRTQIRAVLTKLEVGSQLEAVALYRSAHRW
ncbi:LuxR C-terminal-related transcriptional regulator [Pseudonocardia bannensis]|uniref:Response regulator transcription factor n=1 Tax=Pseudonocardia bannensis TaxID=630973 RepID=A0A848DEZ1_9PSEU|nr:LuxR C-terminal-related transcriptional regulator [Pseudonocardia bannensis]NMH91123.1 response regulator transcription factor [Pseudonocardia bannensis]